MNEIIELINRMSPFVLLGFFLAGLMHAFVPSSLYTKFLGGSSLRNVINATILGIPLPLCSCGVIPTATSLHKEGASKAATVSFLIATPQTGVDSIIATYSLMGLPFALLRPIAAIATALLGGFLTAKFSTEDTTVSVSVKNHPQAKGEKRSIAGKLADALKYAFVDMMQDIGKWLVAGLIVAGLITVFVPESFFEIFARNSLLSMLLVLFLSIPMYLCATGSIPIAVALILKGLSPGAAFVLLMAGPAVNTASMLIIGKVLGRRTLLLYLLSIIGGAIAFGLTIDHLLPREWFTEPPAGIHTHGHEFPLFNSACSVILALLLLNAFIQRHRHKNKPECDCGCHDCAQTEEGAVFTVEGMACNHCKASVEKALMSIEGVTSVEIELADGQTAVYGAFDREKAIAAIEAIGFSVKK